ncbi:MAG TPA: hypothetical protein VFB28_04070 [Terriglobales bacterium]|nr:hypothetical protein [Terriglobales bacterium]
MADSYDVWLDQVRYALRSINMSMDDWQPVWRFDFPGEHDKGTDPHAAAMKANRFWWREQNRSLNKDCQKTPGCWLPEGHQDECQPCYEPGDYVKVEFPDEVTGVGEWMWVRVENCDKEKRLVFGRLDNEPMNDYGGKAELGSHLAVSFERIREHKGPADFKSKN